MSLFSLIAIAFIGAGLTLMLAAPWIGIYSLALMPFGASLAAGGLAFCTVVWRMVGRSAPERSDSQSTVRDHTMLQAGRACFFE